MPVHQTQRNKENEPCPAFIPRPQVATTQAGASQAGAGALAQNVAQAAFFHPQSWLWKTILFGSVPSCLADLHSTAVSEDRLLFLPLALVPSLKPLVLKH